MNLKLKIYIILFVIIFSSCHKEKVITCRIETPEGNIDFELYVEKAPITVTNFLKYVDNRLYEGSNFFRVCKPENEKTRDFKIEVIQGGEVKEEFCFDPIAIETTEQTKVNHVNGTLSMARDEPNSATSQFFICIGDQPELNFKGRRNPDGKGFAAFGKVTKGMDVVKKIQGMDEINQRLNEPVFIQSVKRL